MKFTKPSLRDLKKYRVALAAWMVILLSLAAVNFFWLQPVIDQNEMLATRIKQQEELIQKYEQKLQQTQSIREALAKQEQELKDMQKRLFRGTDPYQLAASLGDLLSSKSEGGQKLEIKTYQVVASKEYGLYQEVHLRFNLMTTVDGLHYFLDKVKDSQFAVLVQEINIQKIQRSKGPDLVVNVILAALMEKGEKT